METEEYDTDVAHTGIEGLKFINRKGISFNYIGCYDAREMDAGITGNNSYKRKKNTPILMLTAKGDEMDKVFGVKS